MNFYKHAAVSFASSALILIVFKRVHMAISCLLTGILLDVDHIFDYSMNRALKDKLRYLCSYRTFLSFLASEYQKSEPGHRVYKLLHSLELLIPASIFYIFGKWNHIATGILIGFLIHLMVDLLPIGHIGAISLIYKASKGFPNGSDILTHRLSKAGRDTDKCQVCNTQGNMIIHKHRNWYAGFTNRGLSKMMILCSDCHDRIHEQED